MKKIVIFVCTTILFIFLTACRTTAVSDIQYGDEAGENALRICIDSEVSGLQFTDETEAGRKEIFENLILEIKNACGIDRISFEILPRNGSERETALQRLRTELMAGGGPDLFILSTVSNLPNYEHKEALLNFPPKNMETGLFLPLDEYMSNNTRFTDWSKQTKAIIDAGRSDEGQVIIPLTYTFPILVYPKHDTNVAYTTELTMQEILDDPKTAELGAVLYTGLGQPDEYTHKRDINIHSISAILGLLADYNKEELLFSEEELYEILCTMFELHAEVEENPHQYIKTDAGNNLFREMKNAAFDEEMSLVPLYSRNGGVTATITSYAAVNRNTHLPKEAFAVIDYLLQENVQCSSELYSFLLPSRSLPLQNDLGQEGKELFQALPPGKYLVQPYFEELLEIKNQITAVNYRSELDVVLEQLVYESVLGESISKEKVSDAYEKMKRMIGE